MGMINKACFVQNQISNILIALKPALTVILAASAAMAHADINPIPSNEIFDLEGAVIAGNGCSADTAGLSVLESEDGIRMSLSMSDFVASIHEGQLAVRKSCLARVPVQIPAGYRLTVVEGGADLFRYSGYSFKGTAGLTHTLSGQTTRVDRTDLANPESDLITLRNPRSVSSECSDTDKKGLLGFNLAVALQAETVDAIAEITADQVSILMKMEPCNL